MITSLFLIIFLSFANFVIGFLPTGQFSETVFDSIESAFNTAYAYNSVFPLDTLFTVLGYSAVFWSAVYLWQGLKWLIHLIRGN